MEATKAAATLDMDYELIFVDDGSKDATPLILSRLAQEDEHVRALSWLAISGINWPLPVEWDHARGDAIITMDGDLQHPPEMIPDLVQKWRDGSDVVQTIREATDDAGFLKKQTSKWYYRVLNAVSPVHITARRL